MMNDLLQIQKDLGAPAREPRRRLASDEELDAPEDGYDPRDWLAMPVITVVITKAIQPIIGLVSFGR